MHDIFIIMKKELCRFFTDKRMLISLFLPAIILFVIYSVMGDLIGKSINADNSHEYVVYVNTMPEYFNGFDFEKEVIELSNGTVVKLKQEVQVISSEDLKSMFDDKKIDLYIEFGTDFDEKITNNLKPEVSVYYASTSTESLTISNLYSALLSQVAIKTVPTYVYTVNPGTDLSTEEDVSSMIIGLIVPYLLIILLISGCMSVVTESIAGEKERGTIAALLITPTKRSSIALGKVLALAITGLVSATTVFIGMILSLPKLMQGSGEVNISLSAYNFSDFLLVFLIIIVTVLFFTVLLSLVSTFAKSVKEATQYATPVMILVIIIGLSSFVGNGNNPSEGFLYFIPIYNSVHCLSGIFSGNIVPLNFIYTIISNVFFISLGIYLLSKMFNSEKIMYNK